MKWPRSSLEGKTHDEIIQYFLTKYGGQEVLAEPINKGFNRLAWLFPYVMGLVGVGAWAPWPCGGRGAGATDTPR